MKFLALLFLTILFALALCGCGEKILSDANLLEAAKSTSTGERMKAAAQMCEHYKPAYQMSMFNLIVDQDAGVRDIIYRNVHKTKDPKFIIALEESRYAVPVDEKKAISNALKNLHEATDKK